MAWVAAKQRADKKRKAGEYKKGCGTPSKFDLWRAVRQWATPPLSSQDQGQLNADWVEWLMQWPIGWTDTDPLPTEALQQWLDMTRAGTWWDVDPATLEAVGKIPTMTANGEKLASTPTEGMARHWDRKRWNVLEWVAKYGAGTGPIPRVTTGQKNRVARLKALGNGQVPLCAATAWSRFMEVVG